MPKYIFGVLLSIAFAVPTLAAAQVPTYGVDYMGPGYGTMNNAGVVIGNESAIYPGTPWVNDGSGLQYLPFPVGATGATAADINDAGVIVGSIDSDGDWLVDKPVVWSPSGSGVYTVELLPLAGDAQIGKAIAINNTGLILGEALGAGMLPTYSAYVIDENGVATDVGIAQPIDINDNGVILTNNQLYDYPNDTAIAFPQLPASMQQGYLYPAALNNYNEVLVNILTATISYTRYFEIGIYTVGAGWDLFMDVQTIYTGSSINDNGDVTLNSVNPGCGLVYLSGIGYYCPASLLDAGSGDWSVAGASVVAIDGTILARGGNSNTAQYGLVRLTPAGDLQAPAAPVHVLATPHVPTWQQNFISIDLTWEAADSLTRSYIVERKGSADVDFVEIGRPTTGYYRDMNIVGGEVYEYHVIAVGLAGNSLPSTVVSAVAPLRGDTEAPVITSISLQNGDVVSGVVEISVTATDDVGISYIRVSASGMNCTVYGSETATCTWDTTGLIGGIYAVQVSAADAMGNADLEIVTVSVEETPDGGGGTGGGKDKPKKGNGGSGSGKGKGNK